MGEYELAIHGHGLLPGLLAVHLLRREPPSRLILLVRDRTICGEHLEPVVRSRLTTASAALVDSYVVGRWPAHYSIRNGEAQLHEEEVLLVDPVQVWLDLQDCLDPDELISDCGAVAHDDGRVTWARGSAGAGRLVDLDPLLGDVSASEIVGTEALRGLGYPVLADFDTSGEAWGALQYIPLGDERVIIRKLPRGDNLLGIEGRFERVLNGLTGV